MTDIRLTENIETVPESVAESPDISVRHRGQELDISRSTLLHILTKDRHLHASEIQLTQGSCTAKQVKFVAWIKQHFDVFVLKIKNADKNVNFY